MRSDEGGPSTQAKAKSQSKIPVKKSMETGLTKQVKAQPYGGRIRPVRNIHFQFQFVNFIFVHLIITCSIMHQRRSTRIANNFPKAAQQTSPNVILAFNGDDDFEPIVVPTTQESVTNKIVHAGICKGLEPHMKSGHFKRKGSTYVTTESLKEIAHKKNEEINDKMKENKKSPKNSNKK